MINYCNIKNLLISNSKTCKNFKKIVVLCADKKKKNDNNNDNIVLGFFDFAEFDSDVTGV